MNGFANGRAIKIFKTDGSILIGQFKDGLRHGPVLYITGKDGMKSVGLCKNGKLQGNHVCTF